MSRLVYGQDDRLVQWASAQLGFNLKPDAKAIGVEDEATGEIRAVFAFDGFARGGCMIHIASDGSRTWLGRNPDDILIKVFAFPFKQCGYRRVTALVAARNSRCVQLVTRRGGVLEGRLRQAAVDGDDLLVFGMLRAECKWAR